jgi:hypothetical protein
MDTVADDMPLFGRIVVIKKSMKDGPAFDLVNEECTFGRYAEEGKRGKSTQNKQQSSLLYLSIALSHTHTHSLPTLH